MFRYITGIHPCLGERGLTINLLLQTREDNERTQLHRRAEGIVASASQQWFNVKV
jgi:hypothetical protein